MKQNSLIEIGSKVNLIIRFNSNFTFGEQTFLAGEPYLYLKNVGAVIEYSNNNKIAGVSPVNLIANSDISPDRIIITNVDFSKKLANLISCYKGSEEYNPTVIKTLVAEREEEDDFGTIYLTEEVKEESDFYIYDKDFNKITNFSYNEGSNSLESESFINDESYLILFSSVKEGTKFSLIKPPLPYMNLELHGTGNIDKINKSVLIYFSKVSLNTTLNLNFLNDDAIYMPLEFVVLDKNNYIVFED